MHDAIIHGQAEQDAREPETDDVDGAKKQPAERKGADENHRQQDQQPKHRN